jgi:hypothetical protein
VPSFTFPHDAKRTISDLEIFGPLVPVSITAPITRKNYLEQHGLEPHPSVQGYALIDTGASTSAIDDRVMRVLEIPILDEMPTVTPHGESFSNVYNASISFHGLELLDIPLEGALGCYFGEFATDAPKIIMLLGRDLLRRFTLHYDGPQSQVTITTSH